MAEVGPSLGPPITDPTERVGDGGGQRFEPAHRHDEGIAPEATHPTLEPCLGSRMSQPGERDGRGPRVGSSEEAQRDVPLVGGRPPQAGCILTRERVEHVDDVGRWPQAHPHPPEA